ncbi:MAG TPA: hypothetical protein VGJ20_35780 [Xanthobacteraceae bacterium]
MQTFLAIGATGKTGRVGRETSSKIGGVLDPIIGTLALQRALTPREAYTGIAGCVIPFVGSWLVDQALPHTT